MEYAEEIVSRQFPISQLEIDDAWATHYGDLAFDENKFPDPKAMTDALFQACKPVILYLRFSSEILKVEISILENGIPHHAVDASVC